MVEIINAEGKLIKTEPTTKPGYSLQDGHYLRGRFANLQQQVKHDFYGVYMRYVPNYTDVARDWLERRQMMRVTRDGKR